MIYQIVYSSLPAISMGREELENILACARTKNATIGVTGALVYADGSFLQILEGEQDKVRNLMESISRDTRHKEVSVLRAGEVSSRVFPDWKMAYVSVSREQIAQWIESSRTNALPGIFTAMVQDRYHAAQVANSIRAVLNGDPAL